MIGSINSFCRELSPALQLIGQVINIFKLALPLVLIALGIFDIGKAVVSNKSDDVKKYMKNFLKKIIVCILVFFIPMLCMVVFGFVGGFNDIKENSGIDYDVCYDCVFKPYSDNCAHAVKGSRRS